MTMGGRSQTERWRRQESRIVENHLLELLPRTERLRLKAICEPVQLVLSEVLCRPGKATRYVYFPTHGYISLVKEITDSSVLEVGMVGREGMVGVQLALGVKLEPLTTLVQGSGAAWRIGARAFLAELANSEPLRRIVNKYIYVMMADMATSAACVRFHLISARLSRWLLITHDRAHADTFRLTHEFLAYMLGVRRVGITTAALALQNSGLISYKRGVITVLDRDGLEEAACSCYSANQHTYDCLLQRTDR